MLRTGVLATVTAGLAANALGAPAPAGGAKRAAPKPKPPVKAPAPLAGPMTFSPPELDLAPGESYPAELLVPSPTGKAVQGKLTYTPGSGVTVEPDSRWTGRVPGWGVKTYPRVSAAADASGNIPVTAVFDRGGQATLTVQVQRPHLEVAPGHQKLTVKVTSPFRRRLLTGRVIASNKDRFLQDVTTREFKIGPGQSQELVFPLPGAAAAEGETYDFTFRVETYQGYKDQQTYPLSFPAQEEKRF